MPSAAAFASKVSRSDFRAALLVPFDAGALESSTNHFVAVSLAAPPIAPEPDPFPAPAGATESKATHRSVTASRRLLLRIPPLPWFSLVSGRRHPPRSVG